MIAVRTTSGSAIMTRNNSTQSEVVEFRCDTRNTQTIPDWEYWEYMGWKGRGGQCGLGYGPRTCVWMDIHNLEISSLFTK